MIANIRQQYNAEFTNEAYQAFTGSISTTYGHTPPFHVAETPVFIPERLKERLIAACDDVCSLILQPDFKQQSQAALRAGQEVPGESAHPNFLVIDFGICYDDQGELMPQLVEVQGFPSLFCYQQALADAYKAHFKAIPDHFTNLFGGLDREAYIRLLKKVIIGESQPDHVVLLELEPEKQTTAIDFYATRAMLGIPFVCLSEVIQEGRDLYYINASGRKTGIERIYNRIIFDDLQARPDFPAGFRLTDEVNAHWVGHPNWFFRISKHTLPLLDSPYVPKSWFLDQLSGIPEDLDQYVLKPLFSFAGMGVIINPTAQDIRNVSDPSNYILQRKMQYAPVVPTPDEPAKVEIRMMMVWEDEAPAPVLVNNLVRLSKGLMTGVRYNKHKTWVGGSVGFFE